MLRLFAAVPLLIVLSCASTRKEAKHETKEKRDLPVLYFGKAADGKSDYFINLRTNRSFDYHEGNDLYPGTYEIKGTTLNLAFQDARSPEDLTGKGLIDTEKKEIILLSKTPASNRRMIITTPK
jgi:hypothetical protein